MDYGVALLRQRLWVRVPSGSEVFAFEVFVFVGLLRMFLFLLIAVLFLAIVPI